MKYITAMVLGFFALIGWMRKYTGIIMILFAFLTCSLFYKNDVIGLIKEQRQQEERQQIRKEKLEQEERELKRQAIAERKKEQKEQQEAAAKKEAEMKAQEAKNMAAAKAQEAKEKLEQAKYKKYTEELIVRWNSSGRTEEDLKRTCTVSNFRVWERECADRMEVELKANPTKPKFDLATAKFEDDNATCGKPKLDIGYVNSYQGKVRFNLAVTLKDGMPTAANVQDMESFPQIDNIAFRQLKEHIAKSAATWDCKGTGTITFNYKFKIGL